MHRSKSKTTYLQQQIPWHFFVSDFPPRRNNKGSYNKMELASLFGRAWVAPMKPLNIPKLESQAALLAAHNWRQNTSQANDSDNRKHYWSSAVAVQRKISSFCRRLSGRKIRVDDNSRWERRSNTWESSRCWHPWAFIACFLGKRNVERRRISKDAGLASPIKKGRFEQSLSEKFQCRPSSFQTRNAEGNDGYRR